MNMEKCKYLLFCGTLALWMAGGFQQVYAATEPSSQAIQQQSNKVTGKVNDATGPIIGASVVEKGTANGTITDLDGNFKINGKVGTTITVSYVGYAPLEVKITKLTGNRFVMKEDSKTLDEVVVVGMGTQKRNTITAAVATVNADAIATRPVTDVTSALQGNVAGLDRKSTRLNSSHT